MVDLFELDADGPVTELSDPVGSGEPLLGSDLLACHVADRSTDLQDTLSDQRKALIQTVALAKLGPFQLVILDG